MVCMTETSLLFVLFMASLSSAQVTKPSSEAYFNAIVQEEIQQPEKKEAAVKQTCEPCSQYGWVESEGRCFGYFSTQVDWATAEAYCLNLGANLVSVHSENEYQLLKAVIRRYDPGENPTWLGLSDCQKRNSWFWSDGTRFDYSRWNPKEPNHKNGECCVNMNWDGHKNWNDIPCNRQFPFVCVKRLA